MGADIHCYTEKLENGKWTYIDVPTFEHRCYSVFAWLAGVRNRDGITPISECRGLPDDVSPEVMSIYRGGDNEANDSAADAEDRLEDIQRDLEQSENEVYNANITIDKLESRIEDLESDLTRLTDELAELKDAINDYRI